MTALIIAMFFFAPLNMHVVGKTLEPTSRTNKLLKKQNSANVEASPQGFLIITK